MQDAEIKLPDLDGADYQARPDFAEMGMKGFQCPAQALVVQLERGHIQRRRQDRLSQPAVDPAQGLWGHQAVEHQHEGNQTQVQVGLCGAHRVDDAAQIQGVQDRIEQWQRPQIQGVSLPDRLADGVRQCVIVHCCPSHGCSRDSIPSLARLLKCRT
jgi:hypothetical protein